MQIFAGTIQSTVICQECGNKSLTFEAFLDLSLSIDNGSGEEGGDESNSHQHHSHKRSRSASLATLTSDTFSDDTGNVTPSGQSSGPAAAATSNGGLNSPTAGSKPAITVADCLRHYTSIENLTEKIVSAFLCSTSDVIITGRNAICARTISRVTNSCQSQQCHKYCCSI